MKFDNLTTKKLFEVAGVDTTKGKAKLLVENAQVDPRIEPWLTKLGVQNFTFNNGMIDVDCDVDLRSRKISQLPGPVQFGHVTGDFFVSAMGLTSLRGCPQTVGGDFMCSYNNLKDLKGGPKFVGECYNVVSNPLVSIEGLAHYIGGSLWLPGSVQKLQAQIKSNVRGDISFEK